MKVRYRANDVVADLAADAAHALVAAGICDVVEDGDEDVTREAIAPTRDGELITPEAPLLTTALTHAKRNRPR